MKVAFITCVDHPDICSDPYVCDDLLAEAIRRRGITVEGAPWDNPDIDWNRFDGLVIRSSYNYYLKSSDFIAWLQKLTALKLTVLNSPEIVMWNIHKSYLLDSEKLPGIQIPSSKIINRMTDPIPQLSDLARLVNYGRLKPVVVKPCVSADGTETYLVREKDIERFQLKFAEMVTKMDLLVQEFVPEIQSDGEWSLVYIEKTYSHAFHKLPKPGDFRIQTRHGGSFERAEPNDNVRRFSDHLMQSLPFDPFYARVDVVSRWSGHVLLMELEMIEPQLFFSSECVEFAVDCLLNRLARR